MDGSFSDILEGVLPVDFTDEGNGTKPKTEGKVPPYKDTGKPEAIKLMTEEEKEKEKAKKEEGKVPGPNDKDTDVIDKMTEEEDPPEVDGDGTSPDGDAENMDEKILVGNKDDAFFYLVTEGGMKIVDAEGADIYPPEGHSEALPENAADFIIEAVRSNVFEIENLDYGMFQKYIIPKLLEEAEGEEENKDEEELPDVEESIDFEGKSYKVVFEKNTVMIGATRWPFSRSFVERYVKEGKVDLKQLAMDILGTIDEDEMPESEDEKVEEKSDSQAGKDMTTGSKPKAAKGAEGSFDKMKPETAENEKGVKMSDTEKSGKIGKTNGPEQDGTPVPDKGTSSPIGKTNQDKPAGKDMTSGPMPKAAKGTDGSKTTQIK